MSPRLASPRIAEGKHIHFIRGIVFYCAPLLQLESSFSPGKENTAYILLEAQ